MRVSSGTVPAGWAVMEATSPAALARTSRYFASPPTTSANCDVPACTRRQASESRVCCITPTLARTVWASGAPIASATIRPGSAYTVRPSVAPIQSTSPSTLSANGVGSIDWVASIMSATASGEAVWSGSRLLTDAQPIRTGVDGSTLPSPVPVRDPISVGP